MVSSGVKITLDKVPEALKALRYLDEMRVLVGVPSSKAGRRDGPINSAAIGFIQENGAPERNLPARPFLIPGVKSIEKVVIPRFKDAGNAVLSADPARAEKQFNAIGLIGQNAVRKKITDGPFAALSPRTLSARRSRGRTGEKPLIDTGQLRQAISYVIRKIRGR